MATDTDHIKNGRRCVFQKLVDTHPGSERLKTYGVTPSRFKSSDYEDFCFSAASASGLAMKWPGRKFILRQPGREPRSNHFLS